MKETHLETLEDKKESLRQELCDIGEIRLGSLFYRYRRCGKKNCACANPEHPGHGQWVVSKAVKGRTVMRTIPAEELLPKVRQQLAEGRRFRDLCTEFAEVSDELARAKLGSGQAPSKEAAKKGASKKNFNGKSLKKSNGS